MTTTPKGQPAPAMHPAAAGVIFARQHIEQAKAQLRLAADALNRDADALRKIIEQQQQQAHPDDRRALQTIIGQAGRLEAYERVLTSMENNLQGIRQFIHIRPDEYAADAAAAAGGEQLSQAIADHAAEGHGGG